MASSSMRSSQEMWTSVIPPSVRSYLETTSFSRIAPRIVSEKKSLKKLRIKTYLTVLWAPFKSLTQAHFSRQSSLQILALSYTCRTKICLPFSVAGGRDGRTICSAFPQGQCVAAVPTAEVGCSQSHNQAPSPSHGCQHCTSGHPGACWDKHESVSQNWARILVLWQSTEHFLPAHVVPSTSVEVAF